MRKKIIFMAFVLCLSAIDLIAQNLSSKHKSDSIDGIRLSSFTLSTGYYKPALTYYNNAFLLQANATDKFGGGTLISGNISVELPLNLGARAGIWYWGNKVNGSPTSTFTSLNVNFTGLSMGLFYTYPKDLYGIRPYIGMDGSYLMVQNVHYSEGAYNFNKGNDFVGMPFVGINRVFYDKLIVGVEYGYYLGRYLQDFDFNAGITPKSILIDGHKLQFTIGYNFK
ncbi:MAG: hypothetical protein WCP85_17740 [Mariniphaga sp.]